MFDDLAGKVAVVTGGARGLGFAMAGALVEHGVRMALVDRLPDVAASARSLATSTGADVVGIVCDVTSTASVDEAFARVVDEFGTPQVLVNAAGIPATQTAVDVTADFFRQALDVNVAGESIYPLVEALEERNVPFVFSTGYGSSGIKDAYRDRPVVQKPFAQSDLRQTLLTALRDGRSA